MQVFEQYCGARSPERETPNMARKRLWFVTDRVAHFARNRGDGDVEKRKSKVGGKGQCSWPGEIHQQLVRHRRLIALIGPFCCSSNFRNGTVCRLCCIGEQRKRDNDECLAAVLPEIRCLADADLPMKSLHCVLVGTFGSS